MWVGGVGGDGGVGVLGNTKQILVSDDFFVFPLPFEEPQRGKAGFRSMTGSHTLHPTPL